MSKQDLGLNGLPLVHIGLKMREYKKLMSRRYLKWFFYHFGSIIYRCPIHVVLKKVTGQQIFIKLKELNYVEYMVCNVLWYECGLNIDTIRMSNVWLISMLNKWIFKNYRLMTFW